uniref:DUF2905 domain-containing protein n=1 Tax=Ammonifex degensii TaxID=42838 RepID=A0A7C2IPV4_9THEO
MEIWQSFGKLLVVTGLIFVVLGLLIFFAGKVPGLGRLPGDIYFHRGNFTFYFPLATCIILSILLTIILNLFLRR